MHKFTGNKKQDASFHDNVEYGIKNFYRSIRAASDHIKKNGQCTKKSAKDKSITNRANIL